MCRRQIDCFNSFAARKATFFEALIFDRFARRRVASHARLAGANHEDAERGQTYLVALLHVLADHRNERVGILTRLLLRQTVLLRQGGD